MNALMSISNGSSPYLFYQKMEMTRPVRKKMEGKWFISRESRHLFFVDYIIKVLFPALYFDLACKQLLFPPGKGCKEEKRNY